MTTHTYGYNLDDNDNDWLHQTFIQTYQHQHRLNAADDQREHVLYGPLATRLAWIYPPFHRFLVIPQASLMPEVSVDDQNAPDTSTTSTDTVDGDVLSVSTGGLVVSQWRDIISTQNRPQVDLVVAKQLENGLQLPLLVVGINRDTLSRSQLICQIEDYLGRIVKRCATLGYNHPVYGLLVCGPRSIRIMSTLASPGGIFHNFMDANDEGQLQYVDTDSKLVNEWLLQQSLVFLNYH